MDVEKFEAVERPLHTVGSLTPIEIGQMISPKSYGPKSNRGHMHEDAAL
jgi:hypothetical protein